MVRGGAGSLPLGFSCEEEGRDRQALSTSAFGQIASRLACMLNNLKRPFITLNTPDATFVSTYSISRPSDR